MSVFTVFLSVNLVEYHTMIYSFDWIFPLSSGAQSWMCQLISLLTLSALIWKGRWRERTSGDFCLLSALSCLACHSREVQRQKRFHFKALRPSLQTPLIYSWTSRTDAAWPKSQNRMEALPKDKILSCPSYQLGTSLRSVTQSLDQYQNIMWAQD